MLKLWCAAWLIDPAPRNRHALNMAWVKRWNIAAVQAPTPRAVTMNPSWEIVEYARTFFTSFCTKASNAPNMAVTAPTTASRLTDDPAIDSPSKNTGYSLAYLAADHWRKQGVLKNIEIVMALPTPGMFGVPEFAKVLEQVVTRYGIDVRFETVVSEVKPDSKELVLKSMSGDSTSTIGYDFLHAVPPQSAPNWVKCSPLSIPGDAKGWVDIDKNTMQHVRYPDVFALGDAGSSPNSKTGAAIRKQAPVVVQNVIDQLKGQEINRHYDGYASCPIVTARNKMLLAEFDYTMRPHKTVPLVNTQKERWDMYLLKRYGLPFMYWHFLMKGKAMTTPAAFGS